MFLLSLFKCLRFVKKPSEPVAQSSPISNYTGYQNGNGNYPSNDTHPLTDPETNENLERGRSQKKRDFFGTLKRRLGRSKSRAKSLERQGAVPIDLNNPNGMLTNVQFIYFQYSIAMNYIEITFLKNMAHSQIICTNTMNF